MRSSTGPLHFYLRPHNNGGDTASVWEFVNNVMEGKLEQEKVRRG